MKRTIKKHTKAPKKTWKTQEIDFNKSILQPGIDKENRQMIVWGRCFYEWTDTICIDIDKPIADVAENLDITHVLALIESASGRAHAIVKVNGLNEMNYSNAYKAIGKMIDEDFDKSCCDLFRGFYKGNRILFVNDDAVPIDANAIACQSQNNQSINSTIIINTIVEIDTNDTLKKIPYKRHQNPYTFVQGQRLNWLKHELKELARKENTTDNLETFAYPYVNGDTTLEKEVQRLIAWQRKNFKPFKVVKKKPNSGRKSEYSLYETWRLWGRSHPVAMECACGKCYSPATSKRYQAKYNKEHGINTRGGKRAGAGRKHNGGNV